MSEFGDDRGSTISVSGQIVRTERANFTETLNARLGRDSNDATLQCANCASSRHHVVAVSVGQLVRKDFDALDLRHERNVLQSTYEP